VEEAVSFPDEPPRLGSRPHGENRRGEISSTEACRPVPAKPHPP